MQAVDVVMDRNGWDSAVIVTDPWHSFRSREMARHLGIDAATSPTRSGPIVQQRHTELRYVLARVRRLLGLAPRAGSGSRLF